MSDFKYNNIDSLESAGAIAKNFSDNLVPTNGVEIVSTTTARRGYSGQTLVSADIISSASGKELLSSSVYSDIFNINMNRESLSTLTKSIFGPSSSIGSLSIVEAGANGSDQPGLAHTGQEAALRLATAGSLGKKYNQGIYDEITSRLNENYNSGSTGSMDDVQYSVPQDTITISGLPVALFSLLTDDEKKWYKERGSKLASFGVVDDSSFLTQGFSFDIPDGLTNLRYFGSMYPEFSNKDYNISQKIIDAKVEGAYPAACLIELLLLLVSKGYKFSGGLGADRGNNPSKMGPDNSPLSSGTPEDKTIITDHAFGRGFDISYFVNSNEKTSAVSSSSIEYTRQLDILLGALNAVPRHLLPDQIVIGNWCSKEYLRNGSTTNSQIGKLVEKYENLKYTTIAMDSPKSSVHKSHIHISFSAYRTGRYSGEGGAIALQAQSQSGQPTAITSRVRQKLQENNITLDYQDKNYFNDESQLSDLQVFELLYSVANMIPEIAAIFTAIAYRESRWRPYAANKYGFFGLLQFGTRRGQSGGDSQVDLLIPTKETIKFWELGFKNWKTETYNKQKITENNIDSILEQIQNTPNAGKEYYDERAWIPKNQMACFRGKIAQRNIKNQLTSFGSKASRALVGPWGESFLTHGWIGGVSFYIASEVYKKATGEDVSKLQEWIRNNVPKDSVVWNQDPDYNNKPKIEVWMDLTLYTKQIIASDKKCLYQDVYL